MPPMQSVLKTKVGVWAATFLIALVLADSTNSNPVAPTSADQASDSEVPAEYAPAALLARYYGSPYRDEEEVEAEKRTPNMEIEEGQHMPRYIQKRDYPSRSDYWNYLKALEEELALEKMSRQRNEDDAEPTMSEGEPAEDLHKVNKRRRRYGFWVTAINKMDHGNLRGFLGKHRNIYNVYKRQAPKAKWLPRSLLSSSR